MNDIRSQVAGKDNVGDSTLKKGKYSSLIMAFLIPCIKEGGHAPFHLLKVMKLTVELTMKQTLCSANIAIWVFVQTFKKVRSRNYLTSRAFCPLVLDSSRQNRNKLVNSWEVNSINNYCISQVMSVQVISQPCSHALFIFVEWFLCWITFMKFKGSSVHPLSTETFDSKPQMWTLGWRQREK